MDDTAFPDPRHDHAHCLDETLARAREAFLSHGMRLTPLRERVLKEVASSHHAVGAYDVLERLGEGGARLAPISIYRALDALVAAGVIHRLESRNAFFACHARHGGSPVVLACERCGVVAEISASEISSSLEAAAAEAGFAPHSIVVELAGLCGHCRDESPPQ